MPKSVGEDPRYTLATTRGREREAFSDCPPRPSPRAEQNWQESEERRQGRGAAVRGGASGHAGGVGGWGGTPSATSPLAPPLPQSQPRPPLPGLKTGIENITNSPISTNIVFYKEHLGLDSFLFNFLSRSQPVIL